MIEGGGGEALDVAGAVVFDDVPEGLGAEGRLGLSGESSRVPGKNLIPKTKNDNFTALCSNSDSKRSNPRLFETHF